MKIVAPFSMERLEDFLVDSASVTIGLQHLGPPLVPQTLALDGATPSILLSLRHLPPLKAGMPSQVAARYIALPTVPVGH